MMKTSHQRAVGLLAMTALVPVAAWAQGYKNQGYWVDGSGNIVASPVAGMCWHSRDWTPALAVEPCAPVAKPTLAVRAPVAKSVETSAASITPMTQLPVGQVKPLSK